MHRRLRLAWPDLELTSGLAKNKPPWEQVPSVLVQKVERHLATRCLRAWSIARTKLRMVSRYVTGTT
eukprot:2693690-Amphidinium_carterae.2